MSAAQTPDYPDYPDYIVVGSGSAGSVVTRRLLDAGAGTVLLLEAGGSHRDNDGVHDPRAWPTLWGTEVDWAYQTTPQAHTADRVHDWPRGRVLGGTSCLNAMQYIRGHRADYDAWAAAGNPGWDYASVLPHFIALEDNEGGASAYHGVGGPLHVSTLRDKQPNPVSMAFVEACLQAGYPRNDDLNAETFEGAGWNPTSIKDGVRQDTWTCFLAPVEDHPNLTVRTGAQVARVLLEGARAVGVELVGGEQLRAGREVIVCAGAIDSPALLLRSGIGPAADLAAAGVDVAVDLPGVGRNLHDHLLLGVVYQGAQTIPAGNHNLSESVLFTHSSRGSEAPDIQIALVHVPFHSPEFSAPDNSYTIAPGIVQPRSRGSVRLRRDGGLDIDPNYLAEDDDVRGLLEGIAMSREIGGQAALADWCGTEVLPGPGVTSEADLREFVAKGASTYYHPAGTCAMGPADGELAAVVDPELRVHGVEGLRIADASVMPRMVSVNPNATITMIGSRAAELVSGVSPRAHSLSAV